MSNVYSSLAKYYDGFLSSSVQDCDYVSWSQYLLSKARCHGVKTVAELACGTGKMTALLQKGGLSVTAIDASAEMLNEAVTRCGSANTVFVRQDMRMLRLLRKADMAACVNDGVNYLTPAELLPFFKRVADNLKTGAPFIFDVSSEYKLVNVLGGNVFYYDYDEATLLWTNKQRSGSVVMDLTLFVKSGETYRRFDEKHVQYVHRQSDVEQALKDAGFDVAEVTANYGAPIKPDSRRITFYAVKI